MMILPFSIKSRLLKLILSCVKMVENILSELNFKQKSKIGVSLKFDRGLFSYNVICVGIRGRIPLEERKADEPVAEPGFFGQRGGAQRHQERAPA
jgi:hypothetical protein